MNTDIKSGTVEGSGAAINIECGFAPSYVKVVNIDSENPQKPLLEWFSEMAAASALKQAGNVCLADGGLAIGSASKKEVLIANTVLFTINGVFYSLATEEVAFTATTHDITAVAGSIQEACYLLSIQASGTPAIITKGATATGAGNSRVPETPDGHAAIGYLRIAIAAGATDFNATTDDLDAAHITDTYVDYSSADGAEMITANGISPYTGGTPPIALTGTLTNVAGSSTVSGSSTLFDTELKVDDEIKLGNEIRTVREIASATSLVVTSAFDSAHSGVTAYLEGMRGDGFTIGADADVNVSGETLVYLALR